jgi:cell division protease FtsH
MSATINRPPVWDFNDSLVKRRNSIPNRIARFFRWGLWWKLILIIFIIGLFLPGVMSALLTVLQIVIQIGVFMITIVIQFVAMFWFLSRSRTYEVMPGAEGINFDDYRGQPELLDQARQIVLLLRGVRTFENAGGEPLGGLLLEGPPGTGKTWLAKAISTEAGVPFYYVDTSSLQGTFVGTGALKVSRIYAKARQASKIYGAAVIFMDEIDSVGARAGVSSARSGPGGDQSGGMGGGDMSGLLSTLLIEMSGFGQEHGWRARLRARFYRLILRRPPPKINRRVLTIGATNRVEALDAALLRPGRFDKKIRVNLPDFDGRREIFAYYLTKYAHDESMDPLVLASETPGYSPADIKYLLNESLRYAFFAGRNYITYADYRRAQPEHEMGLRAPLKYMSDEAKTRLAYYHAGRALGVRLFQPHHRIARITLFRQGQTLGHVSHYPANDSYEGLQNKDQLLNRVRVLLSGRAAEIEFGGMEGQTLRGILSRSNTTQGGHLDQVYWLLNAMVGAGMNGAMFGTIQSSGAMRAQFVQAQEELYQQMLEDTRTQLRKNRHILDALVQVLLEKEELLADEVKAFFDEYGLDTPQPSLIEYQAEELSLTDGRSSAAAD